jgi:GntR family transcriptional regulator, transcriptional repressor for pyruvate dehydrogenase complex
MSLPPENTTLRLVSRGRLADQTAAALREYIVANRLAPGTRLPSETSLAASLGISRNVLRQAVASLQGLGMLRVEQGSGTFVADPADTEIFQQIAAWLGSRALTEADYLEVRAIWERGIYRLVMERAQPADFDRLEELGSLMVGAKDRAAAEALHEEFHEALIGATGNHFLVTIDTILRRFFWEFGYQSELVRKPPVERLFDGHRSIVRLLRAGDLETIDGMIELHLTPHLTAEGEMSD